MSGEVGKLRELGQLHSCIEFILNAVVVVVVSYLKQLKTWLHKKTVKRLSALK